MANVIVVLDRDPIRRKSFIENARDRIAPMPGLEVSHREGDGWAVVWAMSKTAPFSASMEASGSTFVWGDAMDSSGRRLAAQEVRKQLRTEKSSTWDGFHLVLDLDAQANLTAGVDIQGLFPLHYWQGGDVAIAGSSVDTFFAHPAFHPGLDTGGLIGILLLNNLVAGRTLWQDTRRLGVRKQLRIQDGRISEHETFQLPDPDPTLFGYPVEGHVEIMAEALDDAVRRHFRPQEPLGFLFSGGLDSRQLGGILLDQGNAVKALTFGVDGDIEMQCAKAVAKALGMPHESMEIPAEAYSGAALSLMKMEGLASGFSNVLDWAAIPFLSRLPDRVASGHIFDGVVGGIHNSWAFDPSRNEFTFEKVFRRFNGWGFAPEDLRTLLVPDIHREIDVVVALAKDMYESSSPTTNLKPWHFDLILRQRFHVGSSLWPFSFQSWPMSPVFDRALFRTAASMPAASINGRRLQTEMLLARHPRLAAIALDRNSQNDLPLAPRLRDHLRVGVSTKLHELSSRLPVWGRNRENRFYYRTYDFNSPMWMKIRESAEPYRPRIPGVFRREAIDRFLPHPREALRTKDGIIDSANAKILVGLALASNHFNLG